MLGTWFLLQLVNYPLTFSKTNSAWKCCNFHSMKLFLISWRTSQLWIYNSQKLRGVYNANSFSFLLVYHYCIKTNFYLIETFAISILKFITLSLCNCTIFLHTVYCLPMIVLENYYAFITNAPSGLSILHHSDAHKLLLWENFQWLFLIKLHSLWLNVSKDEYVKSY
jgi:hypothetical protein